MFKSSRPLFVQFGKSTCRYVTLLFAMGCATPALATCSSAELGCAVLIETPPPRDGSDAKGLSMSQDGTRIVGFYLVNAFKRAYVWSDRISYGLDGREAFGISGDGLRIVGSRNLDMGVTEAMLWENGIATHLGGLSSDVNSLARSISNDGHLIIGESVDDNGLRKAVKWSVERGQVTITKLAELDSARESSAFGISGDGNVIVGRAGQLTIRNTAVRWLSNGRVEDLGGLTNNYSSTALNANWDGSVIVGRSSVADSNDHAFRWDAGTRRMLDLGTVTGYVSSAATAVNGTGDVIIGTSWGGPNGRVAFRWTQQTGMQDLNSLLIRAGVDMTGIYLSEASAISRNGRLILANSPDRAYLVSYIDNVVAGITTPTALSDSGREAADQRARAMIGVQSLANTLLMDDERLQASSQLRSFIMGGSLAAGMSARYYNGEDMVVRMGFAAARDEARQIDVNRALIASAAAQYFITHDHSRPFMEAGVQLAPDSDLTIQRSYANGARMITVSGHGRATMAYIYGRLGIAHDLTKETELALWVERGRQSLHSQGYIEGLAGNPFNAESSPGRDGMSIAKFRAQVTTLLRDDIEVTLWIARASGFARSSTVRLNIVGYQGADPALASFRWHEFGARLSYALTATTKVDIFAQGHQGGVIGHALHLGIAGRMVF